MKNHGGLKSKASPLQILRNRRKLLQSRFQFFGNLNRQHIGI
jgi:hypothetical protein